MMKIAPLDKAIELAAVSHSGQTDLNGKPYILHPLAVMQMVKDRGGSEEQQIVAIMHDLIEDTEVTMKQLVEMKFSHKIVNAIVALSRKNDEEYERYVDRVKKNKIARYVKMCDLEHNTMLSRMLSISGSNLTRYVKYLRAWLYLNDRISRNDYIGVILTKVTLDYQRTTIY